MEGARKSVAKPPTPAKPVNAKLSNLRKSVAVNPASQNRKSPAMLQLGVPEEASPSKTFIA